MIFNVMSHPERLSPFPLWSAAISAGSRQGTLPEHSASRAGSTGSRVQVEEGFSASASPQPLAGTARGSIFFESRNLIISSVTVAR